MASDQGAVPKMAMHRITHHFPQFLDSFALGRDGVTECGGNVAAFHLVFANLKDDLAHGWTIARNDAGLQA